MKKVKNILYRQLMGEIPSAVFGGNMKKFYSLALACILLMTLCSCEAKDEKRAELISMTCVLHYF